MLFILLKVGNCNAQLFVDLPLLSLTLQCRDGRKSTAVESYDE